VVAALTVLGPKYRMGKKQISNALQILRDSAKEISGNIPTELIALAR
jgi:DNA-binding IclR family transcriptional regulator